MNILTGFPGQLDLMTDTTHKPFAQALFVSLGAGLASALLIAFIQPQSLFGVFLFLIAPLPLVVAGFSYHPLAALLSALVGCLFLGSMVSSSLAIAYAMTAGLPAWLICEAGAQPRRWFSALSDQHGYLTAGTILFGIALYVSGLILGAALWISPSYEGLRSHLQAAFEEIIRAQYQLDGKGSLRLPDGTDLEPVGRLYARAIPGLMALPFFVMIALSGYLGARVARISQRLSRAWPDFRQLRLPALTLTALIMAIGLIFIGDYIGLLGVLLCVTLTLCFILQGLAVIHFHVRDRPGMRWLISASWALLIVLGVTGFAFALLGMIDHVFDLRQLRGPNPKSQT